MPRAGRRGTDTIPALRRVASDAIEARISQIVTRLIPQAAGDPLQIPQRIELHPAALQLLLPVSLGPTVEAHLSPDETLTVEEANRTSAPADPFAPPPAKGKLRGAAAQLMRLSCPIGLHRRGGRTDVIRVATDGPRADATLIRALRAAHKLVARDPSGLPVIESAPTSPHQRRLIRLAFLSPDLQTAILDGRQPRDLTLARLMEAEIPLCWTAQAQMFGTAVA